MDRGAEAAGVPNGLRERRGSGEAGRGPRNLQAQPPAAAQQLPRHSYWLDLWLFLLIDLLLFLFVYFLP